MATKTHEKRIRVSKAKVPTTRTTPTKGNRISETKVGKTRQNGYKG